MRGTSGKVWVGAALVLLLSAASALAGGGEAAAAPAHKAGLPQLDWQWFPSQIFWLTVHFVILYVVADRLILPGIVRTLDARDARIADDLAEARAMTAESKQVRRAYEAALSQARAKAAAVRDAGLEEGVRERQAAEEKLAQELTRRMTEARARITKEGETLRARMADLAVDMTGDIVRKLAGTSIAPEVVRLAMARIDVQALLKQEGG